MKYTYEHDERVATAERPLRARSDTESSLSDPVDRSLLIEPLCNNMQDKFLFNFNIIFFFFILVSMQFWHKGTRILCNSQHPISLVQRAFQRGDTVQKTTEIGPMIAFRGSGLFSPGFTVRASRVCTIRASADSDRRYV